MLSKQNQNNTFNPRSKTMHCIENLTPFSISTRDLSEAADSGAMALPLTSKIFSGTRSLISKQSVAPKIIIFSIQDTKDIKNE